MNRITSNLGFSTGRRLVGLTLGGLALFGCAADEAPPSVGAAGSQPSQAAGSTSGDPSGAAGMDGATAGQVSGGSGEAGAGQDPLLPEDGLITDVDDTEIPVGQTGITPDDSVDLLFVVDNSNSMGDKQAIFRDAVPDLINQMVKPPCFNVATKEFVPFDANGECTGEKVIRVFEPVTDIHIAVISSSLGSHGLGADQMAGNPVCDDSAFEQNDRAHLIPNVRPDSGLDASNGGFLVWNSEGVDSATIDANLTTIVAGFQSHIDAVKERGCGFEAPLEAAYRFLVEPEPYESIVRGECSPGDGTTLCANPTGVDASLLAQRAAFLRPDSHVVVVFLTDENDCSVMDRRQGYFTLRSTPMAGSTLTCETDPNSPCCHTCLATPPAECEADPAINGCTDRARDSLEASGIGEAYNLRCFDQKRRFGLDFLYPTKKYIDGFQGARIVNRTNSAVVDNPLFADGRRKEQVFVVGIVGTPWQDTAEDPNSPAGTLDLKRAGDLDWSMFLPTTEGGNTEPLDPFNVETMDAARRVGKTHPVTGAAIGGAGEWNDINGHDRTLLSGDGLLDDLQFACIFPLGTPKDCAVEGASLTNCDCTQLANASTQAVADYATGNPLCRNPDTGEYGTTQYFAKAYPAPRMLEVLYGMADQGVVSSICPRNVSDAGLQDFGYRPAIRALLLAVAPPPDIL